MSNSKNIYNDNLTLCGNNPKTGFYRNGYCDTGQDDVGTHTVCSSMNDDFLNYTKEKGNDLSSPSGSFPGLKSGDRWCLCALRWKEAYQAGKAPPVDLSATHAKTLDYVNKSLLEKNNNSSENFVILKNHCDSFFLSTIAFDLQPLPSITCSFAKTVFSTGSQLT